MDLNLTSASPSRVGMTLEQCLGTLYNETDLVTDHVDFISKDN